MFRAELLSGLRRSTPLLEDASMKEAHGHTRDARLEWLTEDRSLTEGCFGPVKQTAGSYRRQPLVSDGGPRQWRAGRHSPPLV